MTRTLLLGAAVALVVAGRAAAQADETPRGAAAELSKAYQEKIKYFDQVRKENRERMAKLEVEIEKLDKELSGFETGKEFEDKLRGTVFERYAQERERLRNAVLANPEEIKTAVETGRGLNVILVAMGDWIRRQKFEGDNAKPDPKYDQFRKMAAELLLISADDMKDIPFKTNTAGEKLTLAIGADHPLKFALLPSLLRREEFEPRVKELEKTGDRALDELRKGEPVSPDTERDMITAMEGVFAEYKKFVRKAGKDRNTNDLAAALRAQAFVTNLKGTVRVFTEASRLNEVQLPPFYGGSIEDLMVYMTKHNLRFGACTTQRQREFQMKLFQALRLYFYDLAAMDRIRSASREELTRLDNENRKMSEALYNGEMEKAITRAAELEAATEASRLATEAIKRGLAPPQNN